MPKAVSYIRFSSGTQAKGSTRERQDALISDWLRDHPDISLSDLSQSDLGRSGFTGAHLDHGLGKILKAIEEKKIADGDYVLVEAIDRIGRLEPFEMMNLVSTIVRNGVTIVTLEDNIEYSKEGFDKNQADFFILIGKIQQAHDYSRNLARRISAAYESKRRKARRGEPIALSTPFWLTSSGKLIPERADFVKECIDLYLKGYGTRRIIIELADKYKFAVDIHPTTLKRWFKSTALVGTWKNKGDEIAEVFEPLIEKQTYYRVQRELKRRWKEMSPEETYELSGLVYCQHCSSRFYFRRKRHKDSVIIYANCSTYLKRGKLHCENNRTWPYEALQAIFTETYSEALSDRAWEHATGLIADNIEALELELKSNDKKKDKVLDIILNTDDSRIYKDRLQILKDKGDSLEREIALLRAQVVGEDYDQEVINLDDDINDRRIDTANAHMEEVESDSLHLRDLLKKSGYKISIDGDFAWVDTTIGTIRYSLKRRSQKYGCYIVEIVYPEYETVNVHTDETIIIPSETCAIAVDRQGVKRSANDTKSLLEDLAKYSESDSPYMIRFG